MMMAICCFFLQISNLKYSLRRQIYAFPIARTNFRAIFFNYRLQMDIHATRIRAYSSPASSSSLHERKPISSAFALGKVK